MNLGCVPGYCSEKSILSKLRFTGSSKEKRTDQTQFCLAVKLYFSEIRIHKIIPKNGEENVQI